MENQFAESHLIDYSGYVYIICHTEEEKMKKRISMLLLAGVLTLSQTGPVLAADVLARPAGERSKIAGEGYTANLGTVTTSTNYGAKFSIYAPDDSGYTRLSGCRVLEGDETWREGEDYMISSDGESGSYSPLEVTVIQSCLQRLNQEISAQGEKYSIGIITPYRAQLELIRNRLKQIPLSHIEVDINTVDAFQGSQRDIIIYSTVRSSNQRRIGFLKEEARLNVAFSRAKRALIIVGDGKFLRNPRIPGNRFPYVISYMQEHPEFCQEINIKEFTNAV